MLEAKTQGNQEFLIIERAAGNSNAFLALYDRYFPRVYTYFRYRFGDPALCDDLCAQTFIQALEHIRQYSRERGPFVGWLFGIARNLANKNLNENHRRPLISFEALGFVRGNDESPEELTIEQDEQHRMLHAISTLSIQQRDLLALKFSAELNNREIAALTGLSEQNVSVIIFRAIRKLRRMMSGWEDQDA